MKKKLFASVATLTLLAAGSVFAADIHGRRDEMSMKDGPALMPVARWQGFYAGVNGGYGSANSEIGVTKFLEFASDYVQSYMPASTELSADAFMGGFQIGYNRQFGALVFGIEADYDFGKFEASRDTGVQDGPYDLRTQFQDSVSARDFATLRGRLGAAYGNLFVYGTGGLAVSTFAFSRKMIVTDEHDDVSSLRADSSDVRLGWTIGGGAEYALDNAWSLKAEYLHADFGTLGNDFGSPMESTVDTSLTMDVLRAGINYKFGARDETLK